MQFYNTIANLRVARSLASGVIAVGVQTIIFEIIGIYFHIVSPSTAVVISAECALLTNFYLSNRFIFHDRESDVPVLSRLVRFHLVVSGSIFLQWLFVYITEHRTSSYLLIHAAYATGIVLGFVWNYTFYLLFVWKRSAPSPSEH